MDNHELELSLERVQKWIASADQKTSIFLALIFGLLGLSGSTLFPFVVSTLNKSSLPSILLLELIAVFVMWSVIKAMLVLRPSLSNDERSITYFGHISHMKLSEFRQKITKLKPKDYTAELVEQIWMCSVIARTKHVQLSESVLLLFIALFLSLIYTWVNYVSL